MHAENAPNHASSRRRVLVVDDSANVRMMIRLSLKRTGLDIVETPTGEEALEFMATSSGSDPVAVLICEIKLPGLSGQDIIRQFRTRWPSVCIIVFTGDANMEVAHELLKIGVRKYFLKPALPEEVLNTVQSALAEHQPPQPTYAVSDTVSMSTAQGGSPSRHYVSAAKSESSASKSSQETATGFHCGLYTRAHDSTGSTAVGIVTIASRQWGLSS